MTQTPLSEIPKITLMGRTNAGKSSLFNRLLGKEETIVSREEGTTTDPVTRRIELFPIGPVALTDTAGLADKSRLGQQRMERSLAELNRSDLLLLVVPADLPPSAEEEELLAEAVKIHKPLVIALTHADKGVLAERKEWCHSQASVEIDNLKGKGMDRLLKLLEKESRRLKPEITPLEGLVKEGDLILLVTPIDLAAPKGRLILPQVETLRDALDRDCAALVVKERELSRFYGMLKEKPALVITDSQAFNKVAADLPAHQPLTSFSLLFARKKGDLQQFTQGLDALEKVPRGGKILVLEGCSHHKQAEDIGTVKIPRLFRQMVHSQVEFHHGRQLPPESELIQYHALIHCGACMLKRQDMSRRLEILKEKGIPVTNYGMFLGWGNGLIPRALEPFRQL